jgi:hypothetical protein
MTTLGMRGIDGRGSESTVELACRNRRCSEFGEVVEVRTWVEFGHALFVDDEDEWCGECGERLVDPADVEAP